MRHIPAVIVVFGLSGGMHQNCQHDEKARSDSELGSARLLTSASRPGASKAAESVQNVDFADNFHSLIYSEWSYETSIAVPRTRRHTHYRSKAQSSTRNNHNPNL